MSDAGNDFNAAYPKTLRDFEHGLLRRRRERIGLSASSDRLVGFGLSGGGIRSATFALGLFQGLAQKTTKRSTGLLRHIDYLSTVSGGGYFGSFFGRLLTREYVKTPEDVEEILLGRKEPKVLGFLRENGRYMSPNGAGDSLLLGAALLRNWVSIHIVLILFVLAVFLGLQSLRGVVDLWLNPYLPMKEGALVWWSPLLWLPLASFVLWAVPVGWAY